MIQLNQIYKHSKRGLLYKIVDIIPFQCSTHLDLDYKTIVVYSPVDDETKKWSRLEEEFLEEVELEGEMKPRFQLVS